MLARRMRSAYLLSNQSVTYDSNAERQFLALTNQARAQEGLAPLQLDDGLTQAARAHTAVMASKQQIEHQLPGEPSLSDRLASNTSLHLDHAGENVAYAGSVDQAAQGLMNSAPHRANLLNPSYNMVGIGVVHNGFVLYVTQDFAHGMDAYSAQQAEDIAAGSIAHLRGAAGLSPIRRLDAREAEASACAMARANSLNTPAPNGHYVVRYTTMQPDTLPDSAPTAVQDDRVRSFSVGACYARTQTYPNGVYWVALLFY